ncbi:MAG: putative quinol monooxygenase [Novosphingobium sp.]|jgi:quinol monooxygenase YgiN|uniref:putative quinol monooxygenase n=1 Tax=Novosphingobium sp. TaxID=1874826 RepID=UPI003016934A
MIIVMGKLRIDAEAIEAALPAARKVVAATQSEDGCIQYDYSRDISDPEIFHITERWTSREALAAHLKTPHVAEWIAVLSGMTMKERNIRIYDTDEGEAL